MDLNFRKGLIVSIGMFGLRLFGLRLFGLRLFGLIGLVGLVGLIGLVGCTKEQHLAPMDLGYGYFPNTVGKYVIYDADSIVRNSYTHKTDTFTYQLKEVIASMFTDNSGRPTQRIERYTRPYTGDTTWVLKNVWMGNLTTLNAQRVESNTRYIKLVFPVNLNQYWNGNAYNNSPDSLLTYNYGTANVPFVIGNQHFDSTCTVIQRNDSTLLSKHYSIEVYAKNVGMIYKNYVNVSTDSILFLPLMQNPYAYGTLNYTLKVRSHN